MMKNKKRYLKRKADMFTKRTIRPHEAVTSVDTASEALAVSISEKARVDMEYMAELSGKSEEELAADLSGVIFRDIQCAEEAAAIPKAFVQVEQFPFVAAGEYLSGNVRRKLRMAKALYEVLPAEKKPLIAKNIEALEAVQPVDLTAAEIGVRIGANWIPIDVYQKFMVETFGTSYYAGSRIKILRSGATGQWAITEKNADRGKIKTLTTYGTKRMNAYQILEQALNQRDVRVFDYVEDENGNKKPVLNKKETAIAQDRQELIKQKFSEWIWKDIDRRERLCRIYNKTFNSIRPREYDGSHIRFSGMNPEITLRPHQVNAIAHIMYGGNTLLAHEVGAGKTFEMVAAAMEMKRLGLCTKSLIVVPNHITEQWAAEWLQLYPSANILVATKKDFETQNRKKFCARIATGDYDAVIIGHSQFEKIPMSAERQVAILQQQIDEIMFGIEEAKSAKAERYTVKQLERTRKSLEAKLERLNDQSRKDDLVTFEELGVDRVFVDESHYFKNLYLATKMRNVGGIAQTEAQKSSDLFMKCRYLDEITGNRGIIFATGTPISNSMVELYTIHRYLQYDTLQEMGLIHFDDWASDFGETITAIELSPEGSGYRAKTRFSKFFNLPELMATFKQVADIQTADMLKLPVPKLNMLKASYLSQKYALEDMVLKKYPEAITRPTERIAGYEQDVQLAAAHPKPQEGFVGITILDQPYADKEAAGKAILDVCTKMTGSDAVFLGQYRGFSLVLSYDGPSNEYRMTMKGTLSHTAVLGADVFGNLTRMDNVIDGLSGKLEAVRVELADTQVQLENARTELAAPFAREAELAEKTARLKELNILLNMDQKDKSLIDDIPDEDTPEKSKTRDYTR